MSETHVAAPNSAQALAEEVRVLLERISQSADVPGPELADVLQRCESMIRHFAEVQQAITGAPVMVFQQDSDLRYIWFLNPLLRGTPPDLAGCTEADLFP